MTPSRGGIRRRRTTAITPAPTGDDQSRNHRRQLASAVAAVPLISITLELVATAAADDADDDDGQRLLLASDAFYRSCVKRLLVGSVLRSRRRGCQRRRSGAGSEGDSIDDAVGPSLEEALVVVRVPLPARPSSPSSRSSSLLKFRVVHAKAAAATTTSPGSPPTRRTAVALESKSEEYVVLPSTAILFASGNNNTTKKQSLRSSSHPRRRTVAGSNDAIPSTSSSSSSTTVIDPPEELIVNALHAILLSNHSSPSAVSRCFLLSGTPGVGKTYAVQRAVDIINNGNNYNDDNDNANYYNNNGHDDIVRLVSIRGSELLSGGAGGGQHSAAAAAAIAAKELYDIFEYSAKSMSSSSSSRPSCCFHRNNCHHHHHHHHHWGDDDNYYDERVDVVVDEDDDCQQQQQQQQQRRRHHGATIIFLDEFDALTSSSIIVSSTLAAILDKMEMSGSTTSRSRGCNNNIYNNNNNYDEEGEVEDGWDRIVVVAATNRVDSIPDYLRRPGRLEKEIIIQPPNVDERHVILSNLLLPPLHESSSSSLKEGGGGGGLIVANDKLNLHTVAEACVGYVAADLSALVRRATMLRIEETLHIMRDGSEGGGDYSTTTTFTTTSDSSRIDSSATSRLSLPNYYNITTNNLLSAMDDVGASCLRDATITAPPTTRWEDIGGDAGGAKRALREAIEWPRSRRSAFLALGLSPPRGVLLFGPPGCAKTTLARAAAGASGVAFISLGPADVYSSSYVGDAEAVIRRAFDLARSAAPCVLFFDEIDAIIDTGSSSGKNDQGSHGMGRGSYAEARVLSTFLNEMDGVDGSTKDGVLVLGATNRPNVLDAALMRPGRFDRVVHVPQPDEVARRAIIVMECTKWHDALFKYYSCNPNEEIGDIATNDVSSSSEETIAYDGVEKYFNFDVLASDDISGLMTGAEIVGACRETAIEVMRTIMMESQSTENNDVPPKSKATAIRHIQTLMLTLKAKLMNTTPLLQSERVVKEYTTFGTNNCII